MDGIGILLPRAGLSADVVSGWVGGDISLNGLASKVQKAFVTDLCIQLIVEVSPALEDLLRTKLGDPIPPSDQIPVFIASRGTCLTEDEMRELGWQRIPQ